MPTRAQCRPAFLQRTRSKGVAVFAVREPASNVRGRKSASRRQCDAHAGCMDKRPGVAAEPLALERRDQLQLLALERRAQLQLLALEKRDQLQLLALERRDQLQLLELERRDQLQLLALERRGVAAELLVLCDRFGCDGCDAERFLVSHIRADNGNTGRRGHRRLGGDSAWLTMQTFCHICHR